MNPSTFVRIGGETIDITKPCDVHNALTKIQLKLATGSLRETVRIDGEEVTFTRANDRRLAALILQYRELCPTARQNKPRLRYAKRFRFT